MALDPSRLSFRCKGPAACGDCCNGRWGSGPVWLEFEEMEALAAHLGVDLRAFVAQYTRRLRGRFSLVETAALDCVFYAEGRGCTVYEARPGQCRTYPYWPSLLLDAGAWAAEAERCPGIQLTGEPCSSE